MKKWFSQELNNDKLFRARLQSEINKTLSEETQKPDNEMDMDLINDCVDALLYLNNYDDNAFLLTPKIVKKFHTKLQLSRIFQGVGTLVAVLLLAILVTGIYNSSESEVYIAPSNSIVTTETAPSDKDTSLNSAEGAKKQSSAATTKKIAEKAETTVKNGISYKAKKNFNNSSLTTKNNGAAKSSGKLKKKKNTETKKEKQATVTKEKTTAKQPSEDIEATTKAIDNQPTVVSIKGVFHKGFKSVYFVGENFDPYGIEIICEYSNGKSETISIDKCSVYGFNSNSPGNNTIIVSYGEKAFSFKIIIAQ